MHSNTLEYSQDDVKIASISTKLVVHSNTLECSQDDVKIASISKKLVLLSSSCWHFSMIVRMLLGQLGSVSSVFPSLNNRKLVIYCVYNPIQCTSLIIILKCIICKDQKT